MTCSISFSKCDTHHLTDPLFLSQSGLNISRTDVVKYQTIHKLDKKMRSLIWFPEEISILKDITDYQELNDVEKQIFTETLLRATMLDSIQGRSPSICLLPICTNPELELAISTWDFTETIHSISYSYIIKNVYTNPSQVFDSLMTIKGITDCATSISEYYDELVRWNAKEVLQTEDYDVVKHKQVLYSCLTAINALEAIRFYSAFAVFFNFAENNKMLGTAKILQMIARDESIHVGITSQLLSLLPQEDPVYADFLANNKQQLADIYNDVVNQEIQWVKYIFSKGTLLGLNESMLSDYVYYLGKQKMKSFGIDESMCNFTNVKSDPLPWMKNWLNTGSMQSAPQEIEQINYKSGVIDTNNVDLSDFSF